MGKIEKQCGDSDKHEKEKGKRRNEIYAVTNHGTFKQQDGDDIQ